MYRKKSIIEVPKFGLVRGAMPVRAIKPRIRRTSLPGVFATAKGTLPILRTESTIELDGLGLFEFDPDIVLMAAQPHILRYFEPQADGSLVRREYYPDLALLKADGSVVVVDFKPHKIAVGASWRRKKKLLEEAYRLDHRATFVTVTDRMVDVEPRFSNVKLMLLQREVVADEAAKIEVLSFIERRGLPMTIGDVRRGCRLKAPRADIDRAFSALINLVIDGIVALDLSQPLTDASRLSWRAPAGVSGSEPEAAA